MVDEQSGEERYFAAVAESYDRLQPIVVGPSYEAGLAFVVDLVPHDREDPFFFVDLCCGTAALAQRLLDRFPNSSALCVDSEPAMLQVAARKLAAYGRRAQVRQAELMRCELPQCDLLVSSFAFHHIAPDDVATVLAHIASCLRPGGCLLILDQMVAGPRWRDRIGAQSRRLYQQHLAAALAAGQATQQEIDDRWALKRKMQAEGKDVGYRHHAEELLAALTAAGFGDVGLVWRMFASTILMGFMPGE